MCVNVYSSFLVLVNIYVEVPSLHPFMYMYIFVIKLSIK